MMGIRIFWQYHAVEWRVPTIFCQYHAVKWWVPKSSGSTMQLNDGYLQTSVSTMHLPHIIDLPRSEQKWPTPVCCCHFAERTVSSYFTDQLCAWVWIVKQQLLLMNAVTCTVWRYIEFTSKGTLFLISFFYFSVRKLGCLYASLTHCCWSCLLLIFCTCHPRCEWSRWAGIKEPALLLRHSLFTLWFVCI